MRLPDSKVPKYKILDDIDIPENVLKNWQTTVDMLAEIANVPAALIMRTHAHDIEVFISSHSQGNVYHTGEKSPLDIGLYCETVMSTQHKLLVPNALKYPEWDHNPDIELGMISYCGLPLSWPNGEIFGTICILDVKENSYIQQIHHLMERFRDSIHMSLTHIYETGQIRLQRNAAENAFLEIESHFKQLIESPPNAMLASSGADEKIIFINQKFIDIFGYTIEDVPDVAHWWPLAYPDNEYCEIVKLQWQKYMEQTEAGILCNPLESTVICKDGSTRYIQFHLASTEGKHLVEFIDMTERRRAELALQESQEKLNGLFELSPLGIALTDMNGRYLEFNEAFQAICGYSAEELKKLNYWMLTPSEYKEQEATQMEMLKTTGHYGPYEKTYRKKNGSLVPIRLNGMLVKGQAGHSQIWSIVEDLTEQKAVEKRLQEQRYERESLLGQQVAFQTISAIAHELNQPLAAISAYSEVALRALVEVGASLGEPLSRALNGCVDQAKRAGGSLHELLNFLHMGELVSEPIDLNKIVHDAVLISKIDGLGVFQPTIELEQDLPPVLANRIHVQKVVVNLMRNGFEAMRIAGVPDARLSIKVQTMTGRGMAQVTVQDSGPGLNAETAKLVFEPFFTTKSEGIGLGLVISRALIEANGGQLWIDPDAGPGATFHFTLPFVQ